MLLGVLAAAAVGCVSEDVLVSPVSTTATSTTTTPSTIASTAPTSTAQTSTSSSSSSTTTMPGPLQVGWVGGSEVVLRDVSLPDIANSLALDLDGRSLQFDAYTKDAPTPADTAAAVERAVAAGAEALIVTVNPQWLYGRVCEGVEPPHSRYACLLEVAPITGGDAIDALGEVIAATRVPAMLVLMPTSVDALEDPQLAEPIRVANAALRDLLPSGPRIVVVDERLTAGKPELREGVGFYDMVHPTPSGARQLVDLLTGELLQLLR